MADIFIYVHLYNNIFEKEQQWSVHPRAENKQLKVTQLQKVWWTRAKYNNRYDSNNNNIANIIEHLLGSNSNTIVCTPFGEKGEREGVEGLRQCRKGEHHELQKLRKMTQASLLTWEYHNYILFFHLLFHSQEFTLKFLLILLELLSRNKQKL